MLHAMGAANRPVSDKVMRGMFAARKQVFVDLLKWDVPVLDGAYEIDQFDDAHAHYLVLADRDGGHLGSARLLPTTRPHILDSFYPELCEAAPPSGPDIFEVTSEVLTPRRRRADDANGRISPFSDLATRRENPPAEQASSVKRGTESMIEPYASAYCGTRPLHPP